MSFLGPQDLDEGGMDYPRPKPEPWRLWDALCTLLRGRLRRKAQPTAAEETAAAQAEFWRGMELHRQLSEDCKRLEEEIAQLDEPAPAGCTEPLDADVDDAAFIGGTITAGSLTLSAFETPPPCDRARCEHPRGRHFDWFTLKFGPCTADGCCCPSYVTLQREDPNQ